MTDDRSLDSDTAVASLRVVEELLGRTRADGLWYARYMAVFGVGFGVMTVLVGLGPRGGDGWGGYLAALLALWAVLVGLMLVWALRHRVQGRVPARVVVPGWVGTGLLYAAALWVGTATAATWAWWVLAAVVVPLPLLAAAAVLHTSARRLP